jgi:D-alanyl-D-alanine carboxypeptidase/D-alanyl-D-alanine-endopeptidase (penicillin-binding protein 4)
MKSWLTLAAAFSVLLPAPGSAEQLPPQVRRALDVRQVPADTLSVVVTDLGDGKPVLEWRADEPRNPGSTIKLLTTLVALDVLGPTFTWRTDVFALGDIEAGRLRGDLLLRGGGDPFLVTERVWQLIRQIRQAGIDEIEGELLIDDSFFLVDDEDPGAFDGQPLRAYNVIPNALLMNLKVVRYWFQPQSETGSVRVWLDPPLENLVLENRLDLRQGSCRGYQRGISIAANETLDTVTLNGSFPSGCELYAMDRTALTHADYAYGLFGLLWRETGGRFEGGWRNAETPADAEPIVTFASLPLSAIIEHVNKHSNNVMARQLLFTLGAEVLGRPGTESGGRKVIMDWLGQKGLGSASIEIDNGAGLSRAARITAGDLAALLLHAWRQPYMPEYVSSLALAGHDGTLRRRFADNSLNGRAHMKTGSLDHVTALAGYLQSRSGRRFAVVMLHNHTDVHRGPGQEAQEALLRWLNAL